MRELEGDTFGRGGGRRKALHILPVCVHVLRNDMCAQLS